MDATLTIAGRSFGSRLILGTGKHETFELMRAAVGASGAEMVTVAVRRIEFDEAGEDITSFLPEDILLLPNTSGRETAEEAVRMAKLARAGGLPDWIKLEVIPDPRYLLPDPVETLKAAEALVADGFTVLPYMLPDPILAKRLEEVGCATVMPLAAPIGTGRGLKLRDSIRIMIEQAEPGSARRPTPPKRWSWAPTRCSSTRPSPARTTPPRWRARSGSPSRPVALRAWPGSWTSR